MVNNFLMGGKLGDFLHAMFAVRGICLRDNTKANVYMVDIGWEFGVENTYAELKDIMLKQDYISNFSILKKEDYHLDPIQTSSKNSPIQIFNETILQQGYIDLGRYINSPHLYKVCWSELYSKTFDFPIPSEYAWIKHDKIDYNLKDKILIQRKAHNLRNYEFPYRDIINTYGFENIIFISSSDRDYEEFNWKQIPFYKISTLDQWFTAINSAALVVANLSAPAVMAHALDKPRIIELPNTVDANHCIGEEKYSDNIRWFLNLSIHNLI